MDGGKLCTGLDWKSELDIIELLFNIPVVISLISHFSLSHYPNKTSIGIWSGSPVLFWRVAYYEELLQSELGALFDSDTN